MLRQKLQDDSIVALKSGDKAKLSVLRFIIAQIKNQEIEKFGPVGGELNDEEVMVVLKKFSKELKESIEAFEKGNRTELVADNKKQLDIVMAYLPKEIDDTELSREIDKIIAENKSVFDENPKKIIGLCMGKLKSKADPARIMKLLAPRLQS
ncbi:MAG: hypothetical protein UR68_C0005G0020 [Candidatus Roizmanbacteria bacterium GW2011_GWA2_35_19]|uniref:Uncharacterized protein n=1 Tax=Candidatus Roizmanbacteria bacterium GW2011_GWA2_35_19 TaxID=1618478 RepID=A0A0G0CB22_9BACT|nr:MAG: hypothetical protein UR68_C0005G0020 [Candidatus Roizmanbacteria bacterium GW2011_GWA2_35_19]